MPIGKPHKSVPSFTNWELDIANECAVLLWNGISFETGKKTTSDEELMSYFSEPVRHVVVGSATSVQLSRLELHSLVICAGLKAMLRMKHQISYSQFENFLTLNIKHMPMEVAKANTNAEKFSIMANYVREGGKQLVDVNIKTNAGYRVPLSSRIMFFALPQLPIANLSNGLAKALNLPTRPEYAVRPFYQAFCSGLLLNHNLLQTYSMPNSNGILDSKVYSIVKQSDWWQRRVLDIALLLKFNVASLSNPLPKLPVS